MNILSLLGNSESGSKKFQDVKTLVKTGLKQAFRKKLFTSSTKKNSPNVSKIIEKGTHLEKKLIFSAGKDIVLKKKKISTSNSKDTLKMEENFFILQMIPSPVKKETK
jgi:hypothetical protein